MEITRMLDNDEKQLVELYCDQIIIEKYRHEKITKQKEKGKFEINSKTEQKWEYGYR